MTCVQQEQGMLAVLALDRINALIEARHLLNVKGIAKEVTLLIMALREIEEHHARGAVRLACWTGPERPPPQATGARLSGHASRT